MLRGGTCHWLAAWGLLLGGLELSVAMADDASSSRQYGAGVHAFFQGRYHEAIEHFDRAIGTDGRDPRAYLFRGLAKQRLGWTGDAHTDFLLGSQLEVALKRRDVGTALERVQGADRLTVERYRRSARTLPAAMVQNVVPQATPATSSAQPAPRPGTGSIRRSNVKAVTPGSLAADNSDPFVQGAAGLLGRGEIEAATDEPSAGDVAAQPTAQSESSEPADPFGGDAPIGTGVVAEAGSDAEMEDPFATDASSAADEPAASNQPAGSQAAGTTPPATGGGRGGALGAALRAFSRSVVPADSLRQGGKLLEGIRGGSSGPATMTAGDEDPFGQAAPPAAADSPTTDAAAADDPFAESAAPAAGDDAAEPSADPQQPPADDPGDPFVDDDPFKS